MSQSNKIISIILAGALIGIFVNEYMHDSDFDGIPNEKDEFPNNINEWSDNDKDGIGDNGDTDDDNDGYNDTDDHFPNDSNEHSDHDLDRIGDNEDTDDDNDGYSDAEDIDPLNDLALKFTFEWIELIDKQNNKGDAPLVFYLYQGEEELHRFDNENIAWRVPWQQQFDLNTEFEINVPDNKTEHQHQYNMSN